MNRNYYCKVNSQKEANNLLKTLSTVDENILTTTTYIKNSWNIIGFHISKWCLLDSSYLNKDSIEVPASELIDYVIGKKSNSMDKDALLEEAKRRYPVGTRYRVKEYSSGNYYLEGTVSKTPYWSNNGKEDIISGYDGILWSSKYGWSEIIEEPKVEVKEKIKSTITWKIGDYVVFVEDWSRSKKGNIDKIKKLGEGVTTLYLKKEGLAGSPLYNDCKLKVFPTLQEAQKFSDELLGKNKTNLNVEGLIEGKFYRHNENGNIFKWAKNKQFYLGDGQTSFEYADGCWEGPFSLANASEVKWLKTCIKQDKFIPKEKLDKYDDEGNLMESEEYPEYYECIKGDEEDFITGKIYKINNPKNLEAPANFIDEKGRENGWCTSNFEHFNPSTKSAYDAQFKKDEDYKVGDWVVVLDTPNIRKWDKGTRAIGYVFQIREDKDYYKVFIKGEGSAIDPINKYGINYKLEDVRKALPHEIPVENTVTQKSYNPEESIKLDFEVKWKNVKYLMGIDPVSELQSRKTPDLIDKSKVKVEIKRTKVKQIKL